MFRFAACQFGQKTAGSQLGSIVSAVARIFARWTDLVHVAAWVDDLIFVRSTPSFAGAVSPRGGGTGPGRVRTGRAGCAIVPSSLYGAFLAREETDARVLVITFDASVHGRGAVLRTSLEEPGVEVVGGFRLAADLLGRAFLEPSALPDCPAAQVYRETLAAFLATQEASQLYPLADLTVLIRSDCLGAIPLCARGRFAHLRSMALLHNSLFINLGAMQQLYLHAPGAVLKAEGSRETARARRTSE